MFGDSSQGAGAAVCWGCVLGAQELVVCTSQETQVGGGIDITYISFCYNSGLPPPNLVVSIYWHTTRMGEGWHMENRERSYMLWVLCLKNKQCLR